MTTQLDPWNDASVLAERIGKDGATLFVVVGAEQWCAKCRDLRPQFDAQAADAKQDEVWLWLDLEDHSEFLGEYSPDSLPVLLSYRDSELRTYELLANIREPFDALIAHIRQTGHGLTPLGRAVSDPGIRSRLLMEDWAA